jgi:hypothetical protein
MSAQTWIRSYSIEGVCPYEYNYLSIKAYNVIPAIGGGYLVQGFVEYFDYEFWVWAANVFWKVDENGEVIWRRSGLRWEPYNIIISNGVDRYYCIASISGYSWMEIYDNQMNYIGSYDFELINGIYPSINDAIITDDGIVFAGRIGSDAVTLKTDFEFNLIWQGDPVFNAWDGYYELIKTSNNHYLAAGFNVITQYNAEGDSLWTIRDNPGGYGFYCVAVSPSGSTYVLTSSSIPYDWLLKSFNDSGVCESTVSVDLDRIVFEGQRVMGVLEDGNLIILIPSVQELNKVSPAGSVFWSRSYLPRKTGYGSNIFISEGDSSFVYCGESFEAGITLVKTDSNGIVVSNEDPILTPSAISSSHYPNPARDQITIDYKAESRESKLTLEVFNIRGQMVCSSPLSGSEGSHQLSLLQDTDSRWAPGVYMYRVKDEHSGTSISKRFIKTR